MDKTILLDIGKREKSKQLSGNTGDEVRLELSFVFLSVGTF